MSLRAFTRQPRCQEGCDDDPTHPIPRSLRVPLPRPVSSGAAFPMQTRHPGEAMTHHPCGHPLLSQPKQHRGGLLWNSVVRIFSRLQDKALLVQGHSPILPPQGPACTHARARSRSLSLPLPHSLPLPLSLLGPWRHVLWIVCLLDVSRYTSIPVHPYSPTLGNPPACFLLLRNPLLLLSTFLILDPR